MDVGIDLGTTFSVIAVAGRVELDPGYGEAIYLEKCDVTIIPSPFGEQTFPSAVVLGHDVADDLFGSEALDDSEERTPITFSKRKIGTEERLGASDSPMLAREVAARFLAYLKRCAEQALGQPVRRAVVTHPAYFDRTAVEETRQAAIDAGFDMSHPDQLVMEPVAAALSYTRTDGRDPLRVLTYDLGGGTFDVTLLERTGGVIDMRAFDGDPLLGGYNLDRELVAWLRQQLARRGIELHDLDDPDARRRREHRLLRFAEQIKIKLADQADPDKPVDVRARNIVAGPSGRDVPINERLSRADFVTMIRPLLLRTIEATSRVMKKAKMEPGDIDEVLLVGGSSKGPWISEQLADLFAERAPLLFEPDLCVAAGAAIHGAMVLPRMLVERGVSITVEAPAETPADVIQLGGRVQTEHALPPSVKAIRLLSGSVHLQDALLDEDGGFLFEDVELEEDETSTFVLSLGEPGTDDEIRHSFTVRCEPRGGDTSAVTSVLPQPLSIETQDGLVTLAAEGETLPARVERTFRRLNENPTITLRLFQAGGAIGEVRVEDIPPDAGLEALVELVVEVTRSGKVVGHARIRDSSGQQVLAEAPVAVQYKRQVILPEETLLALNEQVRADLGERVKTLTAEEGPEAAEALIHQAGNQLRLLDRLLELKPLDCQELQARLMELGELASPPRDVMQPTWKEFQTAWRSCVMRLESAEAANREIVAQSGTDDQASLDESMVNSARERLATIGETLDQLERLHAKAEDAHRRRDRRGWGHVQDRLRRTIASFEESPRQPEAPTPILKMLGRREAVRVLMELYSAATRIDHEGRMADWEPEVRRIHDVLTRTMFDLDDIDDQLEERQGRAAVVQLLRHSVPAAEESVRNLGQDLGTTI